MSIRIGIIGAGSVGNLHAEAATRAGLWIAGFCDADASRAARLAQRYPGAIATNSMDELLNLPDMPAVVVGVPNFRHKEIAIAALSAGKDVLLEKPMAMSVAECDQILAAHRKNGRILQMGFVSRQSPTSRAAADLLRAGRLGRVYHIKASLYRRRGIPGLGGWFTNKTQSGGGVLIDLGVHLIDLVLHLSGRPKPVRATAICTSTFGNPIGKYHFTEMWAGPPRPDGVFDVEDAATALIRFDNGLTFELNVTWAINLPEETLPRGVALFGDRGGCYFDVWGRRMVVSTEQDGYMIDSTPLFPPGDPWESAWTRQHELFAQSVTNRTAPAATGEHGREVQVMLEALYRSSAEGREVDMT
jgi:predicted dehydrogenase